MQKSNDKYISAYDVERYVKDRINKALPDPGYDISPEAVSMQTGLRDSMFASVYNNTYIVRNNLKKIREMRGLTQQQLGDMIGVRQSNIYKLESHRGNFSAEMLILCARALNCSPADLLDVPVPESIFKNEELDKLKLEEIKLLRKKLEEAAEEIIEDILNNRY